MNINDLLPQIPILCTLDPPELEAVKRRSEKKVYPEGANVFREGDPGDGLYIIAVGAVKIVKVIDATNEKVFAGFSEKEFFGELALLDGKPRSASAVVVRPSVLLKISVENFNLLMNEAPFAALKIISQIACHLAVRLRESNVRISELENYRMLRS